jgi:hypothetical protein
MSDRSAPKVTLGLRAYKGGAVIVALALGGNEPRLLLSTTVQTHRDGDRLAFEPYHVAAEMPRDPDGKASAEAAQAVAEARDRQAASAEQGLRAIVDGIAQAHGAPIAAALLVNRAGWVTDLLDYSLGWPEHAAVAEGLAVRDALRSGLRACGLTTIELDEKALPDRAALALGRSMAAIDVTLKALGGTAGRPWRKEQKTACLAAWVAGQGE